MAKETIASLKRENASLVKKLENVEESFKCLLVTLNKMSNAIASAESQLSHMSRVNENHRLSPYCKTAMDCSFHVHMEEMITGVRATIDDLSAIDGESSD